MKEPKRILSKPKTVLALALLILANGVLFAREQVKNDYGLDTALPIGGTVIINGEYTVTQKTVDARAAYRRYLQWIDRVRDMPAPDAVEYLNEQKDALADAAADGDGDAELDYAAVNSLLPQADYINGYADWLGNIRANKESMLSFAIFGDPDSFSGRNIIKTADEFEKLEQVKLTIGADGAVDALLSFSLTDYFLLSALLLFALSFLSERGSGIWPVVRAAPNGRLRLAVRRALILLFASVCFTVLLYGTNLSIGFSLYGGSDDLGRAVQSVRSLGRLPELWTVGGFLIRFFLFRIASAFLAGLLLWLMLTAVDNVKYTVAAASFALAVEYGLYTFLPVQSAFNIFKYFNIFTYISLSDLYTNYLNIDIFSYPIGIRSVSEIALFPLCLSLTAACVCFHCRKRPAEGRDLLGGAAYGVNAVADKVLRRLGLFGMELHKTMLIQKGVLIAAIFVYAAFGMSYAVSIPVMSFAELAERQYTSEFAGAITEDTIARMDEKQAELEGAIAAYEAAEADYENGLIEYPMLDKYSRDAESAKTQIEGLSNVRARVFELKNRGKSDGFAPWLIDEIPFESVYGGYAESNQMNAALLAVLALTLLLAGSMAYERQSGMTYLLRSTARGRGAFHVRKLLLAAAATTLVWAVVYGLELRALLTGVDVSVLRAPVQNLSMAASFPLCCPIAAALALLYVCRWLVLFCCAVAVLFISGCARRTETACIASAAATLLPSLLYAYMGIGIFRPLSVILPVAAMPILTPADGAASAYLPWLAAITAIAACAEAKMVIRNNSK